MLLKLKDPINYIGMRVVYFDGRNVFEVTIQGVTKWMHWVDGGLEISLTFSVSHSISDVFGFSVKMESLYMNWNAWIRAMIQEKNLNIDFDAEEYKRKEIAQHLGNMRRICAEMCECLSRSEDSLDAVDYIMGCSKSSIRSLERAIENWSEKIKPRLVKDPDTDWMIVLSRLMMKNRRKQKSREIRRQWRAANAVRK